uniref:Uncharacterized protein n=1 Tax=Lotharella oceanica TaxID=641309 RepID=A0A7S2TJM6_9EUKA|mmetsp:Transcript_1472/g.2791  ORF Transcript_1472/g.2791 Transcript_1472/m.2791 type:complete len:124 (+) Transcript_1472:361-732(+)
MSSLADRMKLFGGGIKKGEKGGKGRRRLGRSRSPVGHRDSAGSSKRNSDDQRTHSKKSIAPKHATVQHVDEVGRKMDSKSKHQNNEKQKGGGLGLVRCWDEVESSGSRMYTQYLEEEMPRYPP